MKSIRRCCVSLLLITALLCSILSSACAADAPSAQAEPGRVTLTLSDGAQRTGVSAPDDVEVLFAAKGGHQLKFHLTADELEWAASLPFQQAAVRFGTSEWEHPGELFYSKDDQALLFLPTSSSSQAYVHYGPEAEAFALAAADRAPHSGDAAEAGGPLCYVNLLAEKGILPGAENGLGMAVWVLWLVSGIALVR